MKPDLRSRSVTGGGRETGGRQLWGRGQGEALCIWHFGHIHTCIYIYIISFLIHLSLYGWRHWLDILPVLFYLLRGWYRCHYSDVCCRFCCAQPDAFLTRSSLLSISIFARRIIKRVLSARMAAFNLLYVMAPTPNWCC